MVVCNYTYCFIVMFLILKHNLQNITKYKLLVLVFLSHVWISSMYMAINTLPEHYMS